MIFRMYFKVDRVHDGDTMYGELDQGLGVFQRPIGLRLAGVDAAELDTDEGKAALAELAKLVTPGDILEVESHGWDKYAGRIDGSPYRPSDGLGIIYEGLQAGWLRPYSGRGPRPW